MQMDSNPSQFGRRRLATVAASLVLAVAAGISGCAEIEIASAEASARLADHRTEMEEVNVLVAYQKKRKEEAIKAGEDPNQYDNAALLREEDRFKRIWRKQREIEFNKFYERFSKLSADVVTKCNIASNAEGTEAWQIDRCIEQNPEAQYDPLKAAGVTFAVLLLAIAGFGAYRQGRRSIDPVAQAGTRLNLTATQGARQTVVTGSYKGHKLRIESAAPEAGGGDKYVRIEILDGIHAHTVVRFGPLATPTGLELPDLDAPEIEDARVPMGYKLRLSDGASAEELLGGDVGFQIREFDPVDVRVHDGTMTVTTWFIVSEADQVVELIDLSLAVAESYKQA